MVANERVTSDARASEVQAGTGKTLSLVTFFLGDEECGVPIIDVHQIIRDTPITRVPNVSPHVEGVLNMRGIVVPIIDLKHRLGLGVRIISEEHRLVIAEVDGRMVGFSADSVRGVIEVDSGEIQSAPDVVLAKVSGAYVTGVVQRDSSIVIILDTKEILSARTGTGSEASAPTRAKALT